ncbi:MAG: hypothetical protein V1911_03535 [Candidatus Micrarchaeota archaeon]
MIPAYRGRFSRRLGKIAETREILRKDTRAEAPIMSTVFFRRLTPTSPAEKSRKAPVVPKSVANELMRKISKMEKEKKKKQSH